MPPLSLLLLLTKREYKNEKGRSVLKIHLHQNQSHTLLIYSKIDVSCPPNCTLVLTFILITIQPLITPDYGSYFPINPHQSISGYRQAVNAPSPAWCSPKIIPTVSAIEASKLHKRRSGSFVFNARVTQH